MLKQTKPKYPDKAFKAGVQGIVRLEIVIGETGSVEKATVVRSIPALDEAAIEAVQKWRFSPARKGGRAVRTVAGAPVAFCIDDKGCKALWEREGGRK